VVYAAQHNRGLHSYCNRRFLSISGARLTRVLTRPRLLDSYLTMYAGSSESVTLAPGQFERIAKALADPRRFAVLEKIAAADNMCAYQKLCQTFPVSKATISHHVKELVDAGLVDSERDGQFVQTRVRPGVIEAYTAELVRRTTGVS
jgi:ArsR family transcriptional regulator, arsenate/arsenite/antimonite-responsive transcriptional repressor